MTVIRCPALPLVENGIVTYSDDTAMSQYDYGTTATNQCDSGYELTGGDTVRTCTGDGSSPEDQWNGTAPVCSGINMHANTNDFSIWQFFSQLSHVVPLPPSTKDFQEHPPSQHLEE